MSGLRCACHWWLFAEFLSGHGPLLGAALPRPRLQWARLRSNVMAGMQASCTGLNQGPPGGSRRGLRPRRSALPAARPALAPHRVATESTAQWTFCTQISVCFPGTHLKTPSRGPPRRNSVLLGVADITLFHSVSALQRPVKVLLRQDHTRSGTALYLFIYFAPKGEWMNICHVVNR